MEVEKHVFDRLLSLGREQQGELLDQVGFDLMNDPDQYYGKIISADRWLDPDPSDVSCFFEETVADPDQRMAEYEKTKLLTADEQRLYRDYVIEKAGANEYHPGLFLGTISCGDEKLVVVTERTGGAFDREASLAGVFRTVDEAIRQLGGPGAVHEYF